MGDDTTATTGAAGDPTDRVVRELTTGLAAFGLASVVAGVALATRATDETWRAFGRQSAAWGAINLTIAGGGAWRGRSRANDPARLRRLLAVNSALDLAYVAVGAHVAHHRTTFRGRVAPGSAHGHGLAVVAQGLGLLTLDLGFARRLPRSRATEGATRPVG